MIIAGLVAYLLGNLNGAVCISALLNDDVRKHGSGNAGMTNFIRNYGSGRAFLVFLIDTGKAFIAAVAAGMILEPYGLALEGRVLGGILVMLGHDFPALLGFRGGKGILTGWFIAFAIDWRVGAFIGVVFFLVYFITFYVSLASVMSAVAFFVGFAIFHWGNPIVIIGALFMSALTLFMHRGNIVRLIKKEEKKVNLFSRKKAQ
jgi:glycerol-3-phosphate acyltransferase PlsY